MQLTFSLSEPANSALGANWTLWGTYYYGQPAVESATGTEIRDHAEQPVGPTISEKDWCLGAMEGTLIVTKADGQTVTYNFDGTAATRQTTCKPYFSKLSEKKLAALERTRFRVARGPYGDGAKNFVLVPYRTLAVDPEKIALGSTLYIPKARGVKITLPDGSAVSHDGYFFAADVGGAIKNNHVDFFLGTSLKSPFKFVTSDDSSTFEAREVVDQGIVSFLRALHET
jgi:3D (Asp-Asp-Asp) domain-containing protein